MEVFSLQSNKILTFFIGKVVEAKLHLTQRLVAVFGCILPTTTDINFTCCKQFKISLSRQTRNSEVSK